MEEGRGRPGEKGRLPKMKETVGFMADLSCYKVLAAFPVALAEYLTEET